MGLLSRRSTPTPPSQLDDPVASACARLEGLYRDLRGLLSQAAALDAQLAKLNTGEAPLLTALKQRGEFRYGAVGAARLEYMGGPWVSVLLPSGQRVGLDVFCGRDEQGKRRALKLLADSMDELVLLTAELRGSVAGRENTIARAADEQAERQRQRRERRAADRDLVADESAHRILLSLPSE